MTEERIRERARQLVDGILMLAEKASHHKLEFGRIIDIKTGEMSEVTDRMEQAVFAAMIEARDAGRLEGRKEEARWWAGHASIKDSLCFDRMKELGIK